MDLISKFKHWRHQKKLEAFGVPKSGGFAIQHNTMDFLGAVSQNSVRCPKCKKSFTFDEGAKCAMSHGIEDHVIQCPKCSSVYTFNLTPRQLDIKEDVTQDYRS